MKMQGKWVVISLFLWAVCIVRGTTIYVDASATGANNGSSWADAFFYLQDALAVAVDGNDIWVAAGTYKPDHGAGITLGNRDATFELKAGVAMYGGFPTGGGTLGQRDPNLYPTILSGDLNGDDQPDFVNYAENSKIISRISWREGTTTLDGLVIEAAYTDDYYGYGLKNGAGGQIIISNCKFLRHKGYAIHLSHPDDIGGEQYIGTLTGTEITNCLFENNAARITAPTAYSAVVYLKGHSPIFRNCQFLHNIGRGIWCKSFVAWPENQVYTNPTFINVVFSGNIAFSSALLTAVFIYGECMSTFINCGFIANGVGALYQNGMSGGGLTTLTNCTIVGNILDRSEPSGIYNDGFAPPIVMSNSIVWGNRSGGIASAYSQMHGNITVTSSCIQDDDENGIYVNSGVTAYNCIDRNPRFVRNPYDGGDGWGVGGNDDYGDLRLQHISPCIDTGDNAFVPADEYDVDGDGNTSELMPIDLDSRSRIVDGDCNSVATVDMGAYEFSYLYLGDFNGGCSVDFADFAVLASAWLSMDGQAGWNGNYDIALPADGIIDDKELEILAENWLLGK